MLSKDVNTRAHANTHTHKRIVTNVEKSFETMRDENQCEIEIERQCILPHESPIHFALLFVFIN